MPKRVCMYCNLVMGESTAVDPNGVPCDTHGVCPQCSEAQLEKMKADKQKHGSVQSFDELQEDVKRRMKSGFYDGYPVLSKVVEEILEDIRNAK